MKTIYLSTHLLEVDAYLFAYLLIISLCIGGEWITHLPIYWRWVDTLSTYLPIYGRWVDTIYLPTYY